MRESDINGKSLEAFRLGLIFCFLALAASRASGQGSSSVSQRHALVIGNGSYAELPKLANPANDAVDMAASLKNLGFDTELLVDADLGSMEDAVVRLGNRLGSSSGSTGFFYYAGHGVQYGGVNYLIPADARIPGESFLKTKALAAQTVLDVLQGCKNGLNVIVLDACRDNPFGWSRSGSRGLSVVGTQPTGSILVYATSAGSVAQDGSGRNGVFTGELLKQLATPGLEIKEVFNRTGAGVQAITGGKQTPAIYSQFFGQAFLGTIAAVPDLPASAQLTSSATSTLTGSLVINSFGRRLDLIYDEKKIASVPDLGDAVRFDALPAGRPLSVKLQMTDNPAALVLDGIVIPGGARIELSRDRYASWLSSALGRERTAIIAAQASQKAKRGAGIGFLVAGIAGGVCTGISYLLGKEAGAAYDAAAADDIAAARSRVQLWGVLFGVSAGIAGTGLVVGPILMIGGTKAGEYQRSIEELDRQIKELKN